MTANSSANSVILFSDNLSAENSKLSATAFLDVCPLTDWRRCWWIVWLSNCPFHTQWHFLPVCYGDPHQVPGLGACPYVGRSVIQTHHLRHQHHHPHHRPRYPLLSAIKVVDLGRDQDGVGGVLAPLLTAREHNLMMAPLISSPSTPPLFLQEGVYRL